MTESLDARWGRYYSPGFSRGHWSLRWFDAGQQEAFIDAVDAAWRTLLASDDWYAWLEQHYDGVRSMVGNEVSFEDGARYSLRKLPGKAGVLMRVPSEAFAEGSDAMDLMRRVIVAFYEKAAVVLGVERPPDLGLSSEPLRRPGAAPG